MVHGSITVVSTHTDTHVVRLCAVSAVYQSPPPLPVAAAAAAAVSTTSAASLAVNYQSAHCAQRAMRLQCSDNRNDTVV